MSSSKLSLMLLSVLLIGSALAQTEIGYCYVSPTGTGSTTNTVRGKITWLQVSSGVSTFVFDLQGLGANAVRGFHAHTWGSIYTTDGTAVGGHYDPLATATHANLVDGIAPDMHHAGDFGNVTAAANGTATYTHEATFDQVQLTAGNSIIGRALIIHANPDSGVAFNTTNGNAGARIGQCVMQATSYGNYYVTRTVTYASADLKRDMYSNMVNGRVTFEAIDTTTINLRARLCGLPSNANVSIVFGDFTDVMENSTFIGFSGSGLAVFPVTANANGVVDYAINTTDIGLDGFARSSVHGRPVAVMDTDRSVIIARGIAGISNVRVPLNGPAGSNIYQTCETSGPGPQPGPSPGPGPQPGSAGQLFMGVSTIMLLIASFLLF